jgi:hypothetical protein
MNEAARELGKVQQERHHVQNVAAAAHHNS